MSDSKMSLPAMDSSCYDLPSAAVTCLDLDDDELIRYRDPESDGDQLSEKMDTMKQINTLMEMDNSQLHELRISKEPRSFYSLEDMNIGPIYCVKRIVRVPSQYHLADLFEYRVLDEQRREDITVIEPEHYEAEADVFTSLSSYCFDQDDEMDIC